MNQPNPNSPRFTPQGLIPTAEQSAIQLAQNKVVLVDANAGAAKTTTLALRIGEALARNLAPEQILALTFTPEARDVLRRRLHEVGVAPAVAARVPVLSFEDFSAWMMDLVDADDVRQCRASRALKGYVLQAMDHTGERYANHVDGLELHTHSLALSQFLDVQLSLKASMALDSDVEFMAPEEAAEMLGVTVTDYLTTLEYERLRLDGGAGAVFRGPFDATYDLACNLHREARLAGQFPDYRLVLCDELHDLNEAAFRILEALIDRPQCFFAGVGDKDQVIHARLGASDDYLKRRFAERFPKLVRYPLTRTYRHGPHLAYAMAEFKHKPVESGMPLRTEIRQAHYDSAADCASRVVAAVRQWTIDGYDSDACAILIRDRHQSMAIENALIDAEIDYRTPPMASYLHRDEILFLRGVMGIALKDVKAIESEPVRMAIVDALIAFSEMQFAPATVDRFKKEIRTEPDLLGDLFTVENAPRDGVEPGYRDVASEGTKRAVIAAIGWLSQVDPAAPAAEVLRELCERVQLATTARRVFVRAYDAEVMSKSVDSLLQAAAASGLGLQAFWAWLNQRENQLRGRRGRKAVLIECAANAKGKEFDHVILPFLQAGEFPHPRQPRRDEENLFYVAATRARARLTLLSPGDAGQRSSFIAEMRLPKSSAAAEVALEHNERAAAAPPAMAPSRHYLTAGFHDKDQVKALGARFDITRRAWYVENGVDLAAFAPWLKK